MSSILIKILHYLTTKAASEKKVNTKQTKTTTTKYEEDVMYPCPMR